jgi:hypothetical protein
MMGDDSKEEIKSREDVFKRAFNDLCVALDKFGPKEVLDLLLIHSRRDEVVYQLLLKYPVVVSTAEFLNALPTRKVDKRTFKRLERKGCLIG